MVVINDSYRLVPAADVLYFCDARWWRWHHGEPDFRAFAGLKVKLEPGVPEPGLHVLRNAGVDGLESDPSALRHGRNSGYQAIGLAVHLGAARIVLLGYDMQPDGRRIHWFGEHPRPTRWNVLERMLAAVVCIARGAAGGAGCRGGERDAGQRAQLFSQGRYRRLLMNGIGRLRGLGEGGGDAARLPESLYRLTKREI